MQLDRIKGSHFPYMNSNQKEKGIYIDHKVMFGKMERNTSILNYINTNIVL